MARVNLSDIAFDAGTQVRAAINEQVVSDYAERMTDGVAFPAIVLFADGCCRADGSVIYYLADGFHRTQAALRNQFRDIEAEVRPGTKEDALWFALGANKANGAQMTVADKKHAIALALRAWPDRSARNIAEQIGCNHSYVSEIRRKVCGSTQVQQTVSGRDGKGYSVDKHALHMKHAEIEEKLTAGGSVRGVARELSVSSHTVGAIKRELGGVDRTKEGVAQRRKDVQSMAERGFSTRQIAAELQVGEHAVSAIAKKEGIVIHADRVVGKTKRHDSNRIVERMAMQAESLCGDVNLIEFSDLDPQQIAGWLKSLTDGRTQLGAFIRRLMKEQEKHGEAA